MRLRRHRWVGFALILLFPGCAASVPQLNPAPTISAPSVISGTPLTSFAEHGPIFSLPAVQPIDVIDQPNVVTLVLTPSDGQLTYDHLVLHLESVGFEIVGKASDSLVFASAEWTGALTSSEDLAALTLRRKRT